MATEISPATLTVTITETITLDGEARGGTITQTIASISEIAKRVMEVPTTEIEIAKFQATNPGAGTFDEADVKYVRLSNRDATNHVVFVFTDEAATEFTIKVDAGNSIAFFGDNSGGVADWMKAHNVAQTINSTVAAGDLVTISAIADTAPVDIEYLIAGT
jgi:hypothetical protein